MTDSTQPPTEPTEGDVNLSPRRQQWSARHLDDATRAILDEDAELFLHQSFGMFYHASRILLPFEPLTRH